MAFEPVLRRFLLQQVAVNHADRFKQRHNLVACQAFAVTVLTLDLFDLRLGLQVIRFADQAQWQAHIKHLVPENRIQVDGVARFAIPPDDRFGDPFAYFPAFFAHIQVALDFALLGVPERQGSLVVLADSDEVERILVAGGPAQRQDVDVAQTFANLASGRRPIVGGDHLVQFEDLRRAGDVDDNAGQLSGQVPGIEHVGGVVGCPLEPLEGSLAAIAVHLGLVLAVDGKDRPPVERDSSIVLGAADPARRRVFPCVPDDGDKLPGQVLRCRFAGQNRVRDAFLGHQVAAQDFPVFFQALLGTEQARVMRVGHIERDPGDIQTVAICQARAHFFQDQQRYADHVRRNHDNLLVRLSDNQRGCGNRVVYILRDTAVQLSG